MGQLLIRKFDVLVAGGGPAGLAAAGSAAKDGLEVAVIEKEPGIANTIRTSGLTWLSEIEELRLPRSFYNPFRRYKICSTKKEHIFETSEAKACVLDVRKLYQYLAYRAAALGAEIFLRTKIDSATYESNKTEVKVAASTPSGRIEFRGELVIDASGFSTIVGRSLGIVNRFESFGIGAEYEAYAENVDIETCALMCGQIYSPAGYAWLFPIGENKVRIGVGIGRPESNEDPSKQLIQLLKTRPGPLKRLGRVCPVEFHSGVVPREPRNLTIADRILLVGDSAGHVNPLVLEGIRFAIKYGRMAGETAKQSIDNNSLSKAQLEKYEMRWKKEVWNDFQVGLRLQKIFLHRSDEQWDKEMSILKSLPTEEYLDLHKCRFSTQKIMKLVSRHPDLVKSQFFSVILQTKMKSFIAHT